MNSFSAAAFPVAFVTSYQGNLGHLQGFGEILYSTGSLQ